MITPFGFYWSKILPISYDNYLSETEILECIRRKVDDTIKEVNRIENFLGEDLPKYIKDEVEKSTASLKKQIEEMSEELEKKYKLLNETIENLKIDVAQELERVERKINEDMKHLSDRLEFIYSTLTNYINVKINNEHVEMLETNRNTLKVVSNSWYNTIKYINERIEKIAVDDLKVVDPIYRNRMVTIQEALDNLVSYYGKGLTAYEYRRLDLTAVEYRDLMLTAREYRLYGINKEEDEDETVFYDMKGLQRTQPTSSVFSAFNSGVNAHMDGYDLTCEQYREFSEVWGAYNLDMYGKYILSGHGECVLLDNVVLHSKPFTLEENGVELFSITLTCDHDEIENRNIFNEESVKNISIFPMLTPKEWNSGHVSISYDEIELTNRGIRVQGYINSTAKDIDGNACEVDVLLNAKTTTNSIKKL